MRHSFALRHGIVIGVAAAAFSSQALAGSGPFKVLYNFQQLTGSTGSFTLARDGMMYGTGSVGGTAGYGTLFKFDPTAKAFTTLYNFQGGADGATPLPGMIFGKNGILYGATAAGGAADDGTVFTFDTKTGTEQVVHSFSGTDGKTPSWAPVLGQDGELYGTTTFGGSGTYGVAYRMDPKTGAESVLINFNGTNGASPNALTLGPAGLLYGTTNYGLASGGGYTYGDIYTLDPSTGVQTILYTFTTEYVELPVYGLVFGANGLIYGTCTNNPFEFNPKNRKLTEMTFYGQGTEPTGPLIADNAGNIYGTAGFPGFSEVFAYDPSTGVTTYPITLAQNQHRKGVSAAGVVLDKKGRLIGATSTGGSTYNHKTHEAGYGTIFSVVP
jgi:uncharacterized repeat protein (TIGR03803 family)